MRRVAVVASASGCGKTTVGRRLARQLGLPFHELDALHHGPGWTEASADELRALVEPIVARDAWVIDGAYREKLGDLVLAAADTIVWLDLPTRVWLPRLVRRTLGRIARREVLWNGNTETLRGAFWGREALILWALRNRRSVRRRYPVELEAYNVVRLRSTADVAAWLSRAVPGDASARPAAGS